MKEIVYITGTPVHQEPYTHRLVGRILAAAARRKYAIRLKVPDAYEEFDRTLLMKIIRDEGSKEQSLIIESSSAALPPPLPGSILFFAGSLDYWRLLMRAPRRVKRYQKVFWVQGIESEESYLKHASSVRRLVLSQLESYALKASHVIICPSDAMMETLLLRYPFLHKNNFITIPNLADGGSRPARDLALWGLKKRPRLALGYMGGLSPWQCFDEACRIVAEVQKQAPDVWFLVLTRDINQAKSTLKRVGVKQYRVRSCTTEQVYHYAASFDLGFMLRKDNIVNYVACPMKWLEYWKCGVPLITTRAVQIVESASDAGFSCIVDINNIQGAAANIIAWASRTDDGKLGLPEQLIMQVEKKWTWQRGAQSISAVFDILNSPMRSYRSMWLNNIASLEPTESQQKVNGKSGSIT